MTGGGGAGPDAVRGNTYSQIQIEELELDQLVRSRKPGLEVPVLPQVPSNPANVWNDVDRGERDG